MSRTYARSPVLKMSTGAWGKRRAAKALRQKEDVGDGRAYTRHYPQYNIIEMAHFKPSGKSRFFRQNKDFYKKRPGLPIKWPYGVQESPAFTPVKI